MLRQALTFACAVALSALIGTAANAQAKYPERPIKIIVPFAAGGGVDAFARLIAQRLQDKFGSAVVVENRAPGRERDARRPGRDAGRARWLHVPVLGLDAYPGQLVIAKPPYDPLTDFTPKCARRRSRRCWSCWRRTGRRRRSPK